MKVPMRGPSPGKKLWVWTLDPAVLHGIDFLAYRLGLFQTELVRSSNGETNKTKLKVSQLNGLAERSCLVSSSFPSVSSSDMAKHQVLRQEGRPFSSLDMMKQMLQKWKKQQIAYAVRDEEIEAREKEETAAKLHHPEALFSNETTVSFRFGMGAFASPTAPGFSGIFRQHWKDFFVTEMVTDASGVGVPISREFDCTVPDLPASLLHDDVTHAKESSGTVNNDNNGCGVGISPSPSFFTVDVEMRVEELLREEDKTGRNAANIDQHEVTVSGNTSTQVTQGKKYDVFHTEEENTDFTINKRQFYLQCYLHKQHIAHSTALANIAQTLRMHPSGISVAGIKDYIGDTIQRVRLENITPAAVLEANRIFRRKKWSMRLSNFSYETEPLVPGRLFGNKFKIVLRDVTAPREDVERALHEFALHGFPNYYGCQRFSWFGGKNDAAFALLQHNWLAFAFRFLGYTSRDFTLRELLQREKKYPNPLQDEYRRNVVRRLRRIAIEPSELDVAPFLSCPPLGAPPTSGDGGPISKKQDLIILQLHGAFLDLNMTSRRLTAQRLSSYLWNQVLTLRLHHFGLDVLKGDMVLPEALRRLAVLPADRLDSYREGICFIENEADKSTYSITDVVHPGFSFNAIQRPKNVVGDYYLQVCGKYHLDWYTHHTRAGLCDFLEPPRPIIRKPINLRHDYNTVESKLTLEFALERGSYANVAITELMKQIRCAGSENILILPAPETMWEIGNRDLGYVTSMQDIYGGFEEGLGFVNDEYELPLVGQGKVWDHEGPLFLPENEDPVKRAYRWGEQHLLRNMKRRMRDEELMKLRLFEKPLAQTLKDGEVDQYAGHTVPILPNTRAKKVFFKVLRRQRRFPGAPKTTPRFRRGAQVQKRAIIQAPFRTINRNTWNVVW